MIELKTKKAKITASASLFICLFALLFFLLRGPYLSNSIKRVFIPFLENVTRERVLMNKAAINLLPFYLQAKGFKMFDKEGKRLLLISKVRVYIDLLGLLSNEVRIRRLTVRNPEITVSRNDIKRISENIKKSFDHNEQNRYKVTLKKIKLTSGSFKFDDSKRGVQLTGNRLTLMLSSRNIKNQVKLSVPDLALKLTGQAGIGGSLYAKIYIGGNRIDIEKVHVKSSGSFLDTEGEIYFDERGGIKDGRLSVAADIYSESLKSIFDLKSTRGDILSFNGSVNLIEKSNSGWPGFELDLKTDSRFYLETLMEIVKINNNVTGHLALKGDIKGKFPDVEGEGKVTLDSAIFDTLPVDHMEGAIAYKKNKFVLNKFSARVYSGNMEGEAYITIPHGDYFVNADVSEISSYEFFKFIKWEPPFLEGKIDGNFKMNKVHGQNMDIIASATYRNTTKNGAEFTDRIETVSADIHLADRIVKLGDAVLSTSMTDITLNGFVDLRENQLELDVDLLSSDFSDLTSPHYERLNGSVTFNGRVEGPTDDPEITGRLQIGPGSMHGIGFTEATADLTYSISDFNVSRLNIQHGESSLNAAGSIKFRKADKLFSFNDPFYDVRSEVKNLNLNPFIASLYGTLPIEGSVSGLIDFKGDHKTFISTGDLVITDNDIYYHKIDKITLKTILDRDKIKFPLISVYKGDSLLNANGTLYFDKKYNFSVFSKGIRSSDIDMFKNYPVQALFSVDINGSGTLDHPGINIFTEIIESSFNGQEIGNGEIKGKLQDDKLVAAGNFVNGSVIAEGEVRLAGNVPWKMDIGFREGRYDFFITGLLDKAPRDLALTLKGDMKLRADNDSFQMQSHFNKVDLNFYGYRMINNDDIDFDLIDDRLQIKSFYLTGMDVDLSLTGIVDIYENIDVHLRGNLDIAPLRTLTEKIAFVGGMSKFDIDVYGSWEDPEAIGEINVQKGFVKFEGFPYKLSNFNGNLYLEKNKVTFESVEADFAGGTITLSGVGFFKKLNLERLFISSNIEGIKIRPTSHVQALFDGTLLYETSPDGAGLAGNIEIIKAKYEKKVDMGSLITGVREVRVDTADYPDFVRKTNLNIRITGNEDILIDNNLARTTVNLELNIMGTVDKYGLIGRIDTGEGNIYFRGNEFNILEGSNVEFIDPGRIAPVFHILADTFVGSHYIKLTLDGTADRFTLTLFSDPPLPERDILTLLTLGEVDSESKGFESGLAATEAASMLAGGLQDAVEDKFKSLTGVERFRVEPHTTAAGALSPKITVGKRLFEDKLFVIYSSSIGTTEENIIKLKYNLNKNISLVGSRDELGSAAGDIKFRFEFK